MSKQNSFIDLLKKKKIEQEEPEEEKSECSYCLDWYKDPVFGFPCLFCCEEY